MMGLDRWARPLRLRMLVAGMLVLLVTGCGTSGGETSAPTATATLWPTVNDAAEAVSPEASPPWQMAGGTPAPTRSPEATIPEAHSGTPVASPATTASATPAAGIPVEAPASGASPVSTQAPAVASPTTPPEAMEAPTQAADSLPVEQPADAETGDGTSGPQPASIPAGNVVLATPGATPLASPGAAVVVTSCSPDSVPAFPGASSSFITTSDVNIRIGPGTDCDLAADILSQGTLLTVTSGPVMRDGQTGTTWVRVEVDGIEGWVATEFLAPDGQ